MDRFDEAVASLEKIDPHRASTAGSGPTSYGLMLGISAYGHLGQTDKVAALRERLDPMLKESDNGEFTGQLAQTFFVFKNYADTERLLDGLRKAGVPELSFGFDPKSKDRLTGEEIRTLTFGHQFEGRLLNDWRTLFEDDGRRRLRPHHDRPGHNRRAQHDRGRHHLSEPGPDRSGNDPARRYSATRGAPRRRRTSTCCSTSGAASSSPS